MGSGILDDDQEYNMVVANFLQKNTLFVSVVQVSVLTTVDLFDSDPTTTIVT